MIEFRGVCKSYDQGRTFAVLDIDLCVGEGELLVLLGSSGCGKTTTLKMINRLIEPTRGRIRVGGQDHRQVDPVALRRSIGYVIQMVGLFPHMTVGQNVATVPGLLGWSRARIAARVDELLDLVGLPPEEYRPRFPSALSGGQRQRVGFARALAAGPRLMLLDEPFGALDPITRDSLQGEFKRLHHKLGLTAVMVTHDMTEALLLADRIAVMDQGRIVRLGTPHQLMVEPGDAKVAHLIETPRRQAEQLEALARPSSTGEQ